jgi:hypothetical protein
MESDKKQQTEQPPPVIIQPDRSVTIPSDILQKADLHEGDEVIFYGDPHTECAGNSLIGNPFLYVKYETTERIG